MNEYGVSVDLSGVALQAVGALEGALPLVTQALQALANEGAARWKSAVLKAPLFQGEKEAYIHSIAWTMTGPFEATISASYAQAGAIETGRGAFDQKIYLQTSLKVRRVVSGVHVGQKYLVVPFRHNTPGHTALAPAMPASVYELARTLKPSRVVGQKQEPNVQGKLDASGGVIGVTRSTYQWGGRLPAGLVGKTSPNHKTDQLAGMVRMDTSTGKGAKKLTSSAYLTFRVMGEWSSGWVRKPQPGLYLARGVSEELRPLAEGALEEAMKRTVLGVA